MSVKLSKLTATNFARYNPDNAVKIALQFPDKAHEIAEACPNKAVEIIGALKTQPLSPTKREIWDHELLRAAVVTNEISVDVARAYPDLITKIVKYFTNREYPYEKADNSVAIINLARKLPEHAVTIALAMKELALSIAIAAPEKAVEIAEAVPSCAHEIARGVPGKADAIKELFKMPK